MAYTSPQDEFDGWLDSDPVVQEIIRTNEIILGHLVRGNTMSRNDL
jgi:hypothetical protein